METVDTLFANLPVFCLTGARVAGLLVLAPVFGQKSLPPVHRVWMTLLLALVLLPAVPSVDPGRVVGMTFAPLVAGELAVGLLIGFAVLVFLESARFAGRLAGVHVGFGMANVIDPVTKEQGTLVDQLQGLMVLVLFVSLGGHRMLVHALGTSFSVVPIGQMHLSGGLANGMVRLFCQSIVLGVQIALPVLASVFLTEVAIGVVARGVPQLNIFTVGLPLRILVGLITLSATMPVFIGLMRRVIERMPVELLGLLKMLGP